MKSAQCFFLAAIIALFSITQGLAQSLDQPYIPLAANNLLLLDNAVQEAPSDLNSSSLKTTDELILDELMVAGVMFLKQYETSKQIEKDNHHIRQAYLEELAILSSNYTHYASARFKQLKNTVDQMPRSEEKIKA